MMKTKNIKEI